MFFGRRSRAHLPQKCLDPMSGPRFDGRPHTSSDSRPGRPKAGSTFFDHATTAKGGHRTAIGSGTVLKTRPRPSNSRSPKSRGPSMAGSGDLPSGSDSFATLKRQFQGVTGGRQTGNESRPSAGVGGEKGGETGSVRKGEAGPAAASKGRRDWAEQVTARAAGDIWGSGMRLGPAAPSPGQWGTHPVPKPSHISGGNEKGRNRMPKYYLDDKDGRRSADCFIAPTFWPK